MISRKNRLLSGFLSFIMVMTLVVGVLPQSKVYASAPNITTEAAYDIGLYEATVSAYVKTNGGNLFQEHGFYYGKTSSCTTKVVVEDNGGSGTSLDTPDRYTYTFEDLKMNTTYYYKAYVLTTTGTYYYGGVGNFTTETLTYDITVETIDTDGDQTMNTIEMAAELYVDTNDEKASAVRVGFESGKVGGTTKKTTDTIGYCDGDEFGWELSGLSAGTSYKYRGFAINPVNQEYVYGDWVTITTLDESDFIPEVTTESATSIALTSAVLNGSLEYTAGEKTEYGFVLGTGVTTSVKIGSTTKTKDFSYTWTGLQPNTKYTYKTYAVNEYGTVYGNTKTFTTKSDTTKPVIEVLKSSLGNEFVYGSTVTFTAEASDNVALCEFILYIDNVGVDSSDYWTDYETLEYTTSTLSVGIHTVKAYAEDDAGNTATKTITVEVTAPAVPEVIDVTWKPETIVEDTNVVYTITTSSNVDTVEFRVDTYLLDTITAYTTSGNDRVFQTTQAIQNPGTREIQVIAYADSVASDTFLQEIVVEEAELEQLQTVTITTPTWDTTITQGESLQLQWTTPSNVSAVDRYIVKIWSDAAQEYTYVKTVYSNSVMVGSYYLQNRGDHSVCVTALKSGYESSETSVHFYVAEAETTLSKPTITGPQSYGNYDAGKDLTFSWNKVSGATKYYYEVRDITDGEPGVTIFSGSTAEKSVAVPGDVLLAGHVIYLYVYAWSSDAQSEEAFACAVIVKSDVSINISAEKLDFDSTADSETITLTSSCAWTATPSESWITVNQYSGSSDSQLQIHVTENTTDKIRWGYVTFEDATGSVIVEVYQATSTAAYMNVDTDTIFMRAARGYSDAIAITANVSWRITSDSDWLFASRSSGTYDQDITLIAEANDSESTRTGTVTIYSGSMSETITVVQEGGAAPTISNFLTSYTTELGDDVPLQGIITAVNNGKLKKVTIKCSNAGGTENMVATVDLKQENTNRFDLADLRFATTNSNIFAGAGTYTFMIYASADNFTVTNNQIGSFTVTVNNTTVLPSVADKGYMNLAATSVTLMGAIENYGSGTFEECGFDLYDADANWIKSYSMKRPTNNSNSFQRTVTGLLPETTYYYCPYIVTSEGIFPAEDNRALIEVTTGKATPIQGIVLLDGTGNPITTSELYGVNGDVLQFGVKTENDSGDIKSVTWLTPNSKIYSIHSSSEKECSIVLNETGTDSFSVNVTDYCGNEYCVAVFVNVYEEEISYELTYLDSLSDEKNGIQYNTNTFTYDSNFFANPSTYYNHNLAKLCMGFVLAGQSTTYYDICNKNETAENRTETIRKMYASLGFENVKLYNYDKPLTNDEDKVAFTIAKKDILVNGMSYDLIVITTRGGNYGAEWVSNFNIGRLNIGHMGFTNAAYGVYNAFMSYCAEEGIDVGGNVKVLITGFSRSAAVSNVVAHSLNKWFAQNGNTKDNVYAYTFATPANTFTDSSDSLLTGNENIFNIVSPDDLVPCVPLASWRFGRYGTTLVLPKYGSAYANKMLDTLDALIAPYTNIYRKTSNGFMFQNWIDQSKAVVQLSNLIHTTTGDLEQVRDKYQVILQDIFTIKENGDGIEDLSQRLIDMGCYLVTRALVDYGFGIVNDIVGFPVDLFVGWIMDYYEDEVVPEFSAVKELVPAFVEAFFSMSKENQNLVVELIFGLSMDNMISLMETYYMYCCAFTEEKENAYEEMLQVYRPYVKPGGHIIATHRMETYLAWLESADAKTLFGDSFDMYNISVACPVNINIYDEEDVLVGRVVNDEIDTSFDLADSLVLSVTDDVKSISIYDDAYYRIEIIPIAEGDMTISIHGTSIVGSGIYENVALHTDSEYQLIPKLANNGNISYELIDTKLDTYAVSEIDNDILLMINSNSDGNGHCVGGGLVAYNEYVTLTAVPYEKEAFIGWYLNDALLSTEISYSFLATQSQTITAKFTENANSLTGDLNGDGIVDTADVALISDWFAGKYASLPFDTAVADFNGDGMYLARAVAGWDGYKVG